MFFAWSGESSNAYIFASSQLSILTFKKNQSKWPLEIYFHKYADASEHNISNIYHILGLLYSPAEMQRLLIDC